MKKILLVVTVGLVLAGCSLWPIKTDTTKVETVKTDDKVVQTVEGLKADVVENWVELSVEAKGKVSAVDFDVESTGGLQMISFVPNRDVFNSVLTNNGSDKLVKVSMGIMKSTSELPTGKISLGKVLCRTGGGSLLIKGFKLIGPDENGKAAQLLVKEIEIPVSIP